MAELWLAPVDGVRHSLLAAGVCRQVRMPGDSLGCCHGKSLGCCDVSIRFLLRLDGRSSIPIVASWVLAPLHVSFVCFRAGICFRCPRRRANAC
jgi:hypothetical protein